MTRTGFSAHWSESYCPPVLFGLPAGFARLHAVTGRAVESGRIERPPCLFPVKHVLPGVQPSVAALLVDLFEQRANGVPSIIEAGRRAGFFILPTIIGFPVVIQSSDYMLTLYFLH